MTRPLASLLATTRLAIAAAATFAAAAAAQAPVDFQRDVRPLLSSRCFACHGPDAGDRKADLRLDVPDGPDGAYRVRDGKTAIAPGDADASELLRRVTSADADERMPPPDAAHLQALTEDEIDVLRRWIADGATYEDHWAFAPPRAPELPSGAAAAAAAAWSDHPIDRLVFDRLERDGLPPSPEADRRTLIRRVTFDLTGLPPTRQEIAAFLADDRDDAYERLVDRLLQSPHYGEHLARYWLDLVRFADTNGMHHDHYRDLTPYRDWVIRAFNDNLPYDRFVTWQLAGDLLDEPTRDQRIASGWHRLHMIIDVGTALPEESRARNVIDRVTAFGTGFLGLTVQCAQCHDHKFDPITQRDFYRLSAFFDNLDAKPETGRRGGPDFHRGAQEPYLELPNTEQSARLAELDAKIATVEAEREAFDAKLALELATQRRRLQERHDAAAAQLKKLETQHDRVLRSLPHDELVSLLDADQRARHAELEAAIAALGKPSDGVPPRRRRAKLRKARAERDALFTSLATEAVLAATSGPASARLAVLHCQIEALAAEVAAFDDRVAQATADHDARIEARDDADAKRTKQLRKQRNTIVRAIPAAMVMKERDTPRETRVFVRGQYDQLGEHVQRGVPAFLPPFATDDDPPSRRDLATWLVQPDHPLTARVAVNRLWQQCFGVGLVKTSEDFGAQGEVPSHPRLLDHLATSFVASGWDVKALLRDIVTSRTYRQSSAATPAAFASDPENRRLARGSRFRMDAEMIRDQVLVASGLWNATMFGRSVKPPQPAGIWKAVTLPDSLPRTFFADDGDRIWRRSVYTFWKRGLPPPQMTILNAPTREYCTARRERTNTPLQALLLLNEPQYLRAARHLALRELRDEPRDEIRLAHIYEAITSHLPDADEQRVLEATRADLRRTYAASPELATELVEDAAPPDVDPVTLATWTMLTSTIFNLDVARTRQ